MERKDGTCIDSITEAFCSYDNSDRGGVKHHALKKGTLLNDRYIIDRVIGKGGFAITYLAYDTAEKKTIAVKEFYPYGIAVRSSDGTTIEPLGNANKGAFEEGVEKFCSEASYIARFRSSSEIMGFYSAFRENGTSYYAMEYFSGITLKEYVSRYGTITPEQAVYIAVRISEALSVIHSDGVVHRDVSPDNIMLCTNGEVKLIDFGAARQFIDCSGGLSVIVKQGFTPLEQYQQDSRQGAWTDIYSLGASLFYGLTVKTPDDPMSRLQDDSRFVSEIQCVPLPLREILIKAVSVVSEQRYQSGEQLISVLRACGINEKGFADILTSLE